METLILVESPNKAKSVPGYCASAGLIARCLPTVGHVLDLPANELAVDRTTYEATSWVPKDERAEENFARLKAAILKAPLVLVASDGDREGEGIASELWPFIPAGKGRRVIFEEITPGGIAAGLKKQQPDLNWGLVEAFRARRLLDRLFGYLASDLVHQHFPGEKVSAGLVQSPALRLVVERWREAQAFKAVPFFKVRAKLRHTAPDGTARDFLADVIRDGQAIAYPSQAEAEAFRLPGIAICTAAEGREKSQKARPPFTASAWLQTAQKALGYNVDKGDKAKQELFVEGRTTYPRTDSVRVAAEAIAYARQELAHRFGPEFVPPQPIEHKDKAGVQGAHEALRPTVHVVCPACGLHMGQEEAGKPWVCDCGQVLDPAMVTIHYHGASADPERLPDGTLKPPSAWAEAFSLIEARFLASQAAPRRVRETILTFDAEGIILQASGEVELFPGWKKVLRTEATEEDDGAAGPPAPEEEDAEEESALPPVLKGERVEILGMDVKKGAPKTPPLFTQASLVAELERKGLGRPSTFREMVSVLLTKEYVLEQPPEKKGKGKKAAIPFLVPSDLGGRLCDFLVKIFTAFMDYGFRVGMEKGLDMVESGKLQRQTFLAEMDKRLQACLDVGATLPVQHQAARRDFGPCPKCAGEDRAGRLVHKRAKRADETTFDFAGCTLDTRQEQPCGYRQQMMNGELVPGLPCPTCQVPMRLVSRKDGGLSWNCSGHDWHLADAKGQLVTVPTCPKCKKAMKHNHTKEDATKFFWGCFECKVFNDSDVWGKVLPSKPKAGGGFKTKPGPAPAWATK